MAKAKAKKSSSKATPLKAGDIQAADYNPRTITDEQLETLGKTMAEFGDISGVVVNVRTGNCVGGHQRLKQIDADWPIKKSACKDSSGTVAVGVIETPWGGFTYREVDWPMEKEQAANLAANSAGGEFNFPAVSDILKGLKGHFDLGLTGFDSAQLKDLLSPVRQDSAVVTLEHKYELVVECENEEQQQEVFEQLTGEGKKCRLLTF